MFILLFITYILFEIVCGGTISPATFKAYLPADTTLTNLIPTLKLNTQYLIVFNLKLPTAHTDSNDYLKIVIQEFNSITFYTASQHFTNEYFDSQNSQIRYKVNTAATPLAQQIFIFATTGVSIKTHSFYANTYNSVTNDEIDKMSDPVTFTVEGGTIAFEGTIIVPNKRFGLQSTYQISLKFDNSLSKSPNKLTFPKPTNLIVGSNNLCLQSLTCTYDSQSNLISVDTFNTNLQQVIKIKFTNPPSISTITFNNFISYIDGYQVDQSIISKDVTGFNDGKLTNFKVEVGSQKVGQSGVYIKYIFTNLNQILTGSLIELILPNEMEWYLNTFSCQLDQLGSSCSQSQQSSQTLTLAITLSNSIDVGQSITLTVNSIRTPYTFKQASQFKLKITNSEEYDYNDDLGSITMTQQSAITILNVDRLDDKNGALTDYTFDIIFETFQPTDTYITFTMTGYQLSKVDKVEFTGTNLLQTTLIVTSMPYTISIQFKENVNPGTYQTKIYNVANLDSQGTGFITAETKNNNYEISTTGPSTQGVILITTPNDITITSMTQVSQYLGAVDQYLFKFNVFNQLCDGCFIIITMPDDNFQTVQTDCETFVDLIDSFTLDTCQVNNKEIQIKIKTATSSKTIQFRLNNLIKNPTTYSSLYYFQIRTQKNSNIMDQSKYTDEKLQFQMKCSSIFSLYFCKECNAQSQCVSCYTDTVTPNIYFKDNICKSTCGLKFYPDSNNICIGCPTNCLECTSSSLCQSCEDQTLYEIKNGKCVKKCTEKQFDYNGICTDCSTSCNTCVDQSTKCTSCGQTNNLLYQNKCISECPTGIFQVGFSCIACTSPCKTCDTGPTICLTCVTNYYYKKATFSCVIDCGNRYYKDGIDCTQCLDPCNNCSSSSICIDCQTGYYLFENSCISTIPNGYYKSGTSLNKCPEICGNCISETECTSCPKNKYLLSYECIDKCPDKYYSANFVCYPCDTSCLLCSSNTLCTQCPENQSQLSGKCYQSCPSKYYSQDYQCLQCQSSCSTCLNGLECQTCPANQPYMFNNLCVQSCQTNYYVKSFECAQCSNECATCDEKGCLICIQNYKYLEQKCLSSCPSGYQDLNNVGICEVVTAQEQDVISNLQENKYVPVPFTIVSAILILSVVVAKIQNSETFFAGSTVGLLGYVVVGSWGVLLILQLDYILEKLETYLVMAAIGAHIVLNLINLFVIKNCTKDDTAFNLWYTQRKSNSCAYIFLNVLSVISFSMTRFYFSKYFGFRFLKCKLSDVDHMFGMNVINGLCAFFCCVPALIASALLAYRDQLREQLFISSIDCFIVTIIFGISLIWEIKKEDNYFDENNNGSVSLSHQVIPEFFQSQRSKQSKRFSFEESINGQKFNHQDEEPSFPKIDESIEYKDPNYSQQPFKKMSQFCFKQDMPESKQDISNRSQEDVVLQMPNNDVSEPLSIGESQRDFPDLQQKQIFEQQQLQILEEQQRQEEIKKQEQERLAELKRIEDLQKQEEERLNQEKISLEQLKEEQRQAELIQQRKIEEEKRQAELKRIEEEEKRLQEEQKIKEQEEQVKKTQEEQAKKTQEEQVKKTQEEQEQKRKEEELLQLLEEQKLQEQKEQELIKQSKQSINSKSEMKVMQSEIDDLKQDIDEFNQSKNNKLNDVILVDHDDDDVGWNIENEENDEQNQDEIKTTSQQQQKKISKEIIQDDKNDVDDDWDVPTSGFVSVQPKSQLKKDQQTEEPINPFKGYSQRQPAESDVFKQSRDDSDDEDWAANQISPSEFNILNQRFDHDKHSVTQVQQSQQFFQTGQNFQPIAKRPTLPDPLINSDNDSFDQEPVFEQFSKNQKNSRPKKQNKGLNKKQLRKQQTKQKGSKYIGTNDIKF